MFAGLHRGRPLWNWGPAPLGCKSIRTTGPGPATPTCAFLTCPSVPGVPPLPGLPALASSHVLTLGPGVARQGQARTRPVWDQAGIGDRSTCSTDNLLQWHKMQHCLLCRILVQKKQIHPLGLSDSLPEAQDRSGAFSQSI